MSTKAISEALRIEEFLDTKFRAYLYGDDDDRSFRKWLERAIFGLLEEKRITGCDSGWQFDLFFALAIVDPKVADLNLVRRYIDLANDDWETACDMRDEIHESLDLARAEEALKTVISYLLAPS